MPTRRRFTKAIELTAAVILAAIAVAAIAVTYTAMALPNCTSCHDFQAGTGAERPPHSEISCVSCHMDDTVVGRAALASRIVFVMRPSRRTTSGRSFASVPAQRCVACHGAEVLVPGVQGSKGLRVNHATCIGSSACTDCHSTTAHPEAVRWPRSPRMEGCFDCHGATNELTGCDVCHSGKRPQPTGAGATFAVTHGPEWEKTHGMGDMGSCGACHEAEKCQSCHGAGVPHENNFLRQHSLYGDDPEAQCDTCHRTQFCSDCHAYEMPHSTSFTVGHSQTVADDGEDGCLTCHEQSDCTGCHEQHVHPVTQEQLDGIKLLAPAAKVNQ